MHIKKKRKDFHFKRTTPNFQNKIMLRKIEQNMENMILMRQT